MPKAKLFNTDSILEKATELFWKKGYHATSIQDLVSHLGLSRSSIYDTFGGKKELFLKTLQLYRTNNITAISTFLQEQENTKIGLKKLFEMSILQSAEDTDKKGCFVVNTTTELIPGDSEIQNFVNENTEMFINILYKFLIKGEQNAEFEKGKNLKSIATLLFTLYSGLKVMSKVQSAPTELLQAVDTVLSLLD